MEQSSTAGASATNQKRAPERKPDRVYLLRRLWVYFREHRWMLLLAVLLTLGGNLLALVGPKLSGLAIDAIGSVPGRVDFPTVLRYAGYMALCYILSAGMNYGLRRLMIRLSRQVVYRMRRDLFNHLVSLPIGFFDRRQAGDVISILSYDVDTINASLSEDIVHICTSCITVIGALFMMLSISPVLILVFAVSIPISFLITRYRAKRVRPLFRLRSKKLGELNGFVEEITGGQRTTKAYHREQAVIDRFDVKNGETVQAYAEADYYACAMGPSVNFVNNLSLTLISVFGALLYMKGAISLGDISSFVLYSRKFSGPINEFANLLAEMQSTFSAAERVFHLLDEQPEPADAPDTRSLCDVRGDVSLSHVRFGYDPGCPVLTDLTLHAKSGSVTAIVGPTGAGKTTIINLLMRFYDAERGTITIDGQDIRSLTRKSLRLAYTMVLQDTWLFHGTVFENIAYGRPDATMERVVAAAKAAQIHDYIMSLPSGYGTVLTDNGSNISKGQKQLLTIARAMLLDTPILILDEATSNVDTQTEQRIQSAMLRLMRGRTCFVIAHRLSTVQNADCILVVNDGDIVEQGTYRELMQKNGFYAELYRAQFESA